MILSIIILNYNTKDITLNCLKSIDKYPFSKKFEVILIDNGSKDGSLKSLKTFKPKKYKFTIIENSSNLGFAKANNQGIKKALGRYILLLNSDTLVTKNSLDYLVEFADNHPDSGVVAPKLLNEDLSVQPSVYREPTLARTIQQYWLGKTGLLDKYAPDTKKPIKVEVVVGACFLITPKGRKKAGSLNENYFMYYEDFDYCREIRKNGLSIYYLPKVEIVHLHGKSGEKLVKSDNQWRRLIPGSKKYHGVLVHYLRWFVIRTSQLFQHE